MIWFCFSYNTWLPYNRSIKKGFVCNSQRKTGSTLIVSKSMPDLNSSQLIVVWFAVWMTSKLMLLQSGHEKWSRQDKLISLLLFSRFFLAAGFSTSMMVSGEGWLPVGLLLSLPFSTVYIIACYLLANELLRYFLNLECFCLPWLRSTEIWIFFACTSALYPHDIMQRDDYHVRNDNS